MKTVTPREGGDRDGAVDVLTADRGDEVVTHPAEVEQALGERRPDEDARGREGEQRADGISAVRRACLNTALRRDRPFARAVRT